MGNFDNGMLAISLPEGVSWVGGEFQELGQNNTHQFFVLNNIGAVIGV